MVELENECRDGEEFMEWLKMDVLCDMVFVFRGKGEVIEVG